MMLAFAALITSAPLHVVDGSNHSMSEIRDNIHRIKIFFIYCRCARMTKQESSVIIVSDEGSDRILRKYRKEEQIIDRDSQICKSEKPG